MLLAFAERTFSTPALRADLVWEAPENEARRVHARELKKENEDWAKVKKGLMTAALQAKSAAATKANKEKVSRLWRLMLTCQMTNETKEHNLRLSLANVSPPGQGDEQKLIIRSTSGLRLPYGHHDTRRSVQT